MKHTTKTLSCDRLSSDKKTLKSTHTHVMYIYTTFNSYIPVNSIMGCMIYHIERDTSHPNNIIKKD